MNDFNSVFTPGLARQKSEINDEIVFNELRVELVKLLPLKVSNNNKIQYQVMMGVECDDFLALAEGSIKFKGLTKQI